MHSKESNDSKRAAMQNPTAATAPKRLEMLGKTHLAGENLWTVLWAIRG
jgi:hypothetical protein